MIRTMITSWARAATVRTHKLILDGSYTLVVHSEEDRRWYSKNPSVDPKAIVVSGRPYGLSGQRNWILDNLVKEGEWVVMADDNIDGLSAVLQPWYSFDEIDTSKGRAAIWHERYGRHRNNCPWADFMVYAKQDVAEAEKRGAHLIGYATNTNPLFRKKKYRDVGYCSGKLSIVKKSKVRFDERLMSKTDFDFTAAHLKEFGRVLVNNYIFPVGRHFEPGGIGTVQQRTPMNLLGCRLLMEKYPGLFEYHDRAGRQKKSEIKFRPTSVKQVQEWKAGLVF